MTQGQVSVEFSTGQGLKQMQSLVQPDNTSATPVYVDVAAAPPGVLEYGNQEAVGVDTNGNLIGPSNPTHAGSVITMY